MTELQTAEPPSEKARVRAEIDAALAGTGFGGALPPEPRVVAGYPKVGTIAARVLQALGEVWLSPTELGAILELPWRDAARHLDSLKRRGLVRCDERAMWRASDPARVLRSYGEWPEEDTQLPPEPTPPTLAEAVALEQRLGRARVALEEERTVRGIMRRLGPALRRIREQSNQPPRGAS